MSMRVASCWRKPQSTAVMTFHLNFTFQKSIAPNSLIYWRSLRDSNPCYSLERAAQASSAYDGILIKYGYSRGFVYHCIGLFGIVITYRYVRERIYRNGCSIDQDRPQRFENTQGTL